MHIESSKLKLQIKHNWCPLHSQTRSKLTGRAINQFTAFIQCERSRSEARKTPEHELIASMCSFDTRNNNRLQVIETYCAFSFSSFNRYCAKA